MTTVTLQEAGGGGGGGGGATYSHHQSAAASVWTVTHNLGTYRPATIYLDDAPTRPVFADIDVTDVNTQTITFPSPVTGWARLSN